MSISTKTGDDGTSALLFNRRVPKTDTRIEACGAVDELNAALGMARAASGPGPLNEEILRIQNELVLLMGELALLEDDRPRYEKSQGKYISAEATERLTALVHEGERKVSLTDWVMPGGSQAGAAFDFARTVCRRSERRVLKLRDQQDAVNPEIVRYLNRLSDLCFVWARESEAPAPGNQGKSSQIKGSS
ncbi:MAG TPA: cob(I)yrinic acid a,c-diamide adenosyltransferase [Chthoniobacteraceae bacterium]|jgi:cob(I)alamin adenosyltransferase|nr:cob(I)yrinic acid a,c-diamide adenosyltransferase [Chthoniobacteraceae bacterium]